MRYLSIYTHTFHDYTLNYKQNKNYDLVDGKKEIKSFS